MKCHCDIKLLFSQGCMCGGAAAERSLEQVAGPIEGDTERLQHRMREIASGTWSAGCNMDDSIWDARPGKIHHVHLDTPEEKANKLTKSGLRRWSPVFMSALKIGDIVRSTVGGTVTEVAQVLKSSAILREYSDHGISLDTEVERSFLEDRCEVLR